MPIPSLKLAHKGFILVAIPLTFEIAFIFYLSDLLHKADFEVEREIRSSQIIVSANNLIRFMVIAGVSGGEANITHKSEFRDRFNLYCNKLNSEFSGLEDLVRGDKTKERNLVRVKEKSSALLEIIASKFDDNNELPLEFRLLVGAKNMAHTEHSIEVISSSLRQMTKEELKIKKKNVGKREKADSNVRTALYQGLMANLFLTVLLAMYFGNSISKRLRRLNMQAKRLTQKTPLTINSNGSDEIAELERELIKTATTIRNTEHAKENLMESVTSRLDAPLSSIKEVLEAFCNGSYGAISQKGLLRFSDASLSINNLIRLTQNFLDLERLDTGSFELKLGNIRFAEVAEAACLQMAGQAKRYDVSLKTELTDRVLVVDRDRCVQVLINILSNVLKHAKKQSIITLKSYEREDRLRIDITDLNRLISSFNIANFFESKPEPELSIAKRIVEKHGGALSVSSCQSEGTTMSIELPLAGQEG